MKTLDRTLVCVYVAIMIAPLLAMLVRFEDHKINGALPKQPRPSLTVEAVTSEAFQKGFTGWYESHLGLKGFSIYADNTILYRIFGETRYGANVRIGDDDVLFELDDLSFYNRLGDTLPSVTQIEEQADIVASLQQRLRAEGRAFLPMLSPSKATIYRDTVPSRWRRDLGEVRPSDRMYTLWKAALDRRRVAYIDVRELMAHSGQPRAVLWGPSARHWSPFVACLVLRDGMAKYVALGGVPAADYACELSLERGAIEHDEFDLWRLTNAFAPRPAKTVPMARHAPVPPGSARPSLFLMGTSFCWMLLREAEASGRFARQIMNYYNRVFELPDSREAVEPGSSNWRERTLGNDIYIVDTYEIYVTPNVAFMQELGAALPTPP